MGRAVEDAQVRIAKLAFQRFGLDQKLGVGKAFGCGHAGLSLRWCLRASHIARRNRSSLSRHGFRTGTRALVKSLVSRETTVRPC